MLGTNSSSHRGDNNNSADSYLDDILESDGEPGPNMNDDDGDEFDPQALLASPFFDDSQGELNVNLSDDPSPASNGVGGGGDGIPQMPSRSSGGASSSDMERMQQLQQMQQLQMQQQRQQQAKYQQQFANFDQRQQQQHFNQFGSSMHSNSSIHNGSLHNGSQHSHSTSGGAMDSSSMSALEVQQKLQGMQQQMEMQQQQQQAQMHQSAGGGMDISSGHDPNHNRMQQQQNPSMVQQAMQQQSSQGPPSIPRRYVEQQQYPPAGSMSPLVNPAGMGDRRNAPGRSISMPVTRLNRGSMNSPTPSMQSNLVMMQRYQLQQVQASLQQQNNNNNNNNNPGGMSSEMMAFGHQSMDSSMGSISSNMSSQPQQGNAMNNMSATMAMMQQQQGMSMSMSQLPLNGLYGGQTMAQQQQNASSGMQGMMHPSLAHPGELLTTGSFDPSAFATQNGIGGQQNNGQGQQGEGQVGVNEAMEKLCESMRRSAMSRSLVKHLSNQRGVVRQNSGPIARQNSARLAKQMSGRSIGRANSGKALQRTHSGRQNFLGLGDDHGGPALPVRRISDPKHRINAQGGPPSRGVNRHKSDLVRKMPHLDDHSNSGMY